VGSLLILGREAGAIMNKKMLQWQNYFFLENVVILEYPRRIYLSFTGLTTTLGSEKERKEASITNKV